MKYHSPLSSIVISIIVVLVFVSVSFFTVAFFHMDSPTEIFVSSMLGKLEAENSNIDISFSSIDRNLASGIRLRDVKVALGGRQTLSVDSIEVRNGFFSLIGSLLFGRGEINVTFDHPVLFVDGQTIEDAKSLVQPSENGGKTSLTAAKYSFDISVRFVDAEIGFGDILSVPSSELYFRFSTVSGLLDAEADIPSLVFSMENVQAEFDGVMGKVEAGDQGYFVNLSVSEADASYEDMTAYVESFAVETSIPQSFDVEDLKSLPFRFSARKIEFEKSDDNIFFRSYPMSLSSSDSKFDVAFSYIFASYDRYALYLDGVSMSSPKDISSLSVAMNKFNIYEATDPLCHMDSLVADISIPAGSISLRSDVMSSSYVDVLTDGLLKQARVEDIVLNARLGEDDSIAAELLGHVGISSKEMLIDGLSSDMLLSLSVRGDSLEKADLRLSGITNSIIVTPVLLDASYTAEKSWLSLDYGSRRLLDVTYEDLLSIVLRLEDFHLSEFKPVIGRFFPSLVAYVGDDTLLNGSLEATLTPSEDAEYRFVGPVDYAFALTDMRFKSLSFNLGSGLSADLEEKALDVNSFNFTTDFVRLVYSGSIRLDKLLPDGVFSLDMTETGRELLRLSMDIDENDGYIFLLDMPVLGQTSLEGDLRFDGPIATSNAVLSSYQSTYDFLLSIDTDNHTFALRNDRADIDLCWTDGAESTISFREFPLPVAYASTKPCLLDGTAEFMFDFAKQEYSAHTENFRIENMRHLPNDPSIEFSLDFSHGVLSLENCLVTSLDFDPMVGNANFDFSDNTLALLFESESEKLVLSLAGVEEYYSGLFSAERFDLRRLGFEDGLLDASLVGRGSELDDLSFSGGFLVQGSDMVNRPLEMKGELFINRDTLRVTDLSYVKDTLSMSCPEFYLSAAEGSLSIPLSFSYVAENRDRDYPLSFDLDLEISSDPADDLYRFFRLLYDSDFSRLSGQMAIRNFNLDDRFLIEERVSQVRYDDGDVIFTGDLVDGVVDIVAKKTDLNLDLSPLVSLAVSGAYSPSFDLDVSIIDFNVSSINMLFPSPIVTFGEQSIASADITLLGSLGDVHMYGDVWADRVDVDVFWVPDDHLIAHNAHFAVWDNNIKSALTAVTCVEDDTQKRKKAAVQVEFNLLPSFGFDYYQIDCYVPDGSEISFRLPLPEQNFDMVGRVSGWYMIRQTGIDEIYMEADANCDDFTLSGGMNPLPDWFTTGNDITNEFDFRLLLRNNVSFIYPLGANPIITAFAAENQNLRIYSTPGGGFGASGSIELRAGEIYYFQKSFFIREGNIELRENDLSVLDPVVNLRAQLRDFDSSGEKVDIYLVLRDASLTNFTPTFESSPAKDLSEIMSILGQSILSSDGTSGNLGSVVSIVSTGFDVLSRIGYFNVGSGSDSFRNSIRNSLNLDTFSLHTNIIENLVSDAVGLAQNSLSSGISPLASYLDGTTLYMGKYLTPDIYLEAMVHLAADRNNGVENTTSFLTSDLSLDTEISLEWENPLCTVQIFTQPSSLNAFEFFDTLGFALSKRFVF